jgi:hypothetical protein
MPDRLSLRRTLLLVALAFGLAFAVQAPLGGGSSAAEPAAKQSAPGLVASAPTAEPDLSLAAAGTVPALRDPRQPRRRRVRTRKPARKNHSSVRRVVKVAPKLAPAPVMVTAPVRPTPTATPRYIAPAPRRSTPAPKPKPKPKPAPAPTPEPSSEFDSSSDSTSEFDSSGGS